MKLLKFPKFDRNIWQMMGPSIVSLGLGLGSGEYILWPFLAAHYGFGILWGALIGISIQLILILEIQRYTSVKGEDIVSGLGRLSKAFPPLLIFATVVGFGWPGFAATSSKLAIDLFQLSGTYTQFIPHMVLLSCALILLLGRNVYTKLEPIQSGIVILSFMVLTYIFIRLVDGETLLLAFKGFAGIGEGYRFLPNDLDLTVFIGAMAYAGTGGTLLLSQSFFTIEEGHGMARYAKPFTLWLKGKSHSEEDITPGEDVSSLRNFKQLLSLQRFEGFALFWGMGIFTIFVLSYIAYVSLNGTPGLSSEFDFLLQEANALSSTVGVSLSKAFLGIGILALISVQLGIFDIMGRISAKAIQHLYPHKGLDHNRLYIYAILLQLFVGLTVFSLGFQEPLWLIVTGAVINASVMVVVSVGIILLNMKVLPKAYRPSRVVAAIILLSALFYTILLGVNIFG